MICNAAMAFTPWGVTSLFAFSIENHILGGNLVYVIMVLIAVVAVIQVCFIKDPVALNNSLSADSEE